MMLAVMTNQAPKPSHALLLAIVLGVAQFAMCQGSTSTKLPDECECIFVQRKAACEAGWKPEISSVFMGKVTRVDRKYLGEGDTAQFQVEKVFRGELGSLITARVETAVCSPWVFADPLKDDQEYVVYAMKDSDPSVLRINSCTRVVPMGNAKDDLAYWNSLKLTDHVTVFGTLKANSAARKSHEFHELDEEKYFVIVPLANEEVRIEGEGRTYSTQTDSTGRYELRDLSPGNYAISVHNPARPQSLTVHEVNIPSKACAEVDFRRTPAGETVFDETVRSATPPDQP